MSNRTTVKANIVTKNVPSVSNTILTDMLNAEMADNIKFIEDVATVQSSYVSSITCNFTGKDRIDLTRTGGSLNISVSGIGDGAEKDLLIVKTAGQAVTFVGVTDITPIKANANALSTVLYRIIRKGTNYYAYAIAENVKTATESIEGVLEIATTAEAQALAVDTKIITPNKLNDVLYPNGSGWITPTLNSGFTHIAGNNFKYRKLFSNKMEVKGGFTSAPLKIGSPFNFPSGYRPAQLRFITRHTPYDNLVERSVQINTGGNVYPSTGSGDAWYAAPVDWYFNEVIPLD